MKNGSLPESVKTLDLLGFLRYVGLNHRTLNPEYMCFPKWATLCSGYQSLYVHTLYRFYTQNHDEQHHIDISFTWNLNITISWSIGRWRTIHLQEMKCYIRWLTSWWRVNDSLSGFKGNIFPGTPPISMLLHDITVCRAPIHNASTKRVPRTQSLGDMLMMMMWTI